MIGSKVYILTAITILGLLWLGGGVSAQNMPEKKFRWNQENFNTLPHPQITNFSFDKGTIKGELADGSTFRQYTIYENACLRIQKFELDDYSHYVVNGEIAYELGNLSILISEGCQTTS